MNQIFTIEAGARAFGDGQHPTTVGVLTALEAIDAEQFSPRIACDMGCGSGILSLAIATKFGCKVMAVDRERQAVETVRKNAVQNGLDKMVTALYSDGFSHPDIVENAPYALITMNILAEPLLALAADAEGNLADGGVLILSGMLPWQEPQIRDAYQSLGLELTGRLAIGDWVSLTLQKP